MKEYVVICIGGECVMFPFEKDTEEFREEEESESLSERI